MKALIALATDMMGGLIFKQCPQSSELTKLIKLADQFTEHHKTKNVVIKILNPIWKYVSLTFEYFKILIN